MSIKITTGSKPAVSHFHQLKAEQPFVDEEGCLCIKVDTNSYIQVADSEGHTCTRYEGCVDDNTVVKKALPMISKWEF